MADLGYLILMVEIHFTSSWYTSVLLDVHNLNALINYFQTFYVNSTVSFELKGVCLTEMYEQNSAREVMCKAANDDQPNNHSNTNINTNIMPNDCVNLRCCCALTLTLCLFFYY